eukprot:3045326-Pyramimonas_sp.AAC.1
MDTPNLRAEYVANRSKNRYYQNIYCEGSKLTVFGKGFLADMAISACASVKTISSHSSLVRANKTRAHLVKADSRTWTRIESGKATLRRAPLRRNECVKCTTSTNVEEVENCALVSLFRLQSHTFLVSQLQLSTS